MSGNPRYLKTEEQRERLHIARRHGGMCAGCGRVLGGSETVYIEQFEIGPEGSLGVVAWAAVGVECASPGLVEEMKGREPERCAGCNRGVYYRVTRARRTRALCSRVCGARVQAAKRPKSR